MPNISQAANIRVNAMVDIVRTRVAPRGPWPPVSARGGGGGASDSATCWGIPGSFICMNRVPLNRDAGTLHPAGSPSQTGKALPSTTPSRIPVQPSLKAKHESSHTGGDPPMLCFDREERIPPMSTGVTWTPRPRTTPQRCSASPVRRRLVDALAHADAEADTPGPHGRRARRRGGPARHDRALPPRPARRGGARRVRRATCRRRRAATQGLLAGAGVARRRRPPGPGRPPAAAQRAARVDPDRGRGRSRADPGRGRPSLGRGARRPRESSPPADSPGRWLGQGRPR